MALKNFVPFWERKVKMKSINEIESLIKKSCIKTVATTDARILADAGALLQKPVEKEKVDQRLNLSFLLRPFFRKQLLRFAISAVIVIGVFLGIYQFGGDSSKVYAQMTETMKQMLWTHWIVISQRTDETVAESWYNFEDSIFAQKRNDGILVYNNLGDIEFTYNQLRDKIYLSNIRDIDRDKDFVPAASFQFIHIILDYLKKEAANISRDLIVQAGQDVEVVYAKMAASCKIDKIELKRDVKKNLLLSLRVDYKDSTKDIIGIFDYPKNGPQSIYDLGVSQNTEVVNLIIPSDIPQLIKRINSLRQTSLTDYIALSLPSDNEKLTTSSPYKIPRYFTANDNLACVIYRKQNERCQRRGYFSIETAKMLNILDLHENIQNISEEMFTVSSTIYNSDKIFCYQLLDGKPVRNMLRGQVETYGSRIFIEQICWPKIIVPKNTLVKWKVESVSVSNKEPLIMIERSLESGITERWFLNPARNYICQKNELIRGDTLLSEMEILEYAKTKNGQWYPEKIKNTEYRGIKGNGETFLPETTCKIIYLLENPILPKILFDPNSLPKP